MKLDLGSGKKPMDGFFGVDKVMGITDFNVHLWADGAPWPFADDSVDELWSSHFIEHIDLIEVPVWRKVRAVEAVERAWIPDVQGYTVAGGWLWQRTAVMRDALLHFFSEAYRIAKPGASFTVIWPCIMSRSAYRDPTHRRFIDIDVVHYLGREGRKVLDVEQYEVDCNWVGSATNMTRKDTLGQGEPTDEMIEALRQRAQREWNVTDESLMQLVAEKGTP